MALAGGEVVKVVVEGGVEALVIGGYAGDVVEGGEEGGCCGEMGLPAGVGGGFYAVCERTTRGAAVLGLQTVDIGGLFRLVLVRIKGAGLDAPVRRGEKSRLRPTSR